MARAGTAIPARSRPSTRWASFPGWSSASARPAPTAISKPGAASAPPSTSPEGDARPQQQEKRERDRAGGTSGLGLLYQLSEDRGAAPAIGRLGRVRTIYGPGRTAYEAEGVALVGKTFQPGRLPLGIHANFAWTTRIDPQPGDRTNRYLFNASIGQAVTSDLALILTYPLSQQERGDCDFSPLQAGFRYRLPSGPVVGVAAGAGLNRDTPALQISVAVQFALGN